jgi:hypothetical protein
MDGPRRLGRPGRNARPGAVAQRSRPLPVLRCTNHDGGKGKTERGSRGCSPRVAKGSARGGCGLGRLLRAWVMTVAQCGGPSAPRRRWESSQRRPCPPPSFNCGERRWIGGARRWLGFGSCRSKFGENRPLFKRLLVWTCTWLEVLKFLSINQTLIWLRLKDFWKGNELEMVTIRKSNSRLGLHGLRKKPYPKLGREVGLGRVRVGKPG